MNKEQKKFKEVIKKRKKRLMRLARLKVPKYKFVEVPAQAQAPSAWLASEKQSWFQKIINKIKSLWQRKK
jgi:hypothetical protein